MPTDDHIRARGHHELEGRHGVLGATFSLVSETMVETEAIRNQRRADLMVDARVPVVKLQAFHRLRPTVEVVVEQGVSAKVVNEQGGVIVETCHHLERGS